MTRVVLWSSFSLLLGLVASLQLLHRLCWPINNPLPVLMKCSTWSKEEPALGDLPAGKIPGQCFLKAAVLFESVSKVEVE